MSNGVVDLNIEKFKNSYPVFRDQSDSQIEMVFFEATIILNNTKQSPIRDLQRREFFIYLAMAHILTLAKQQSDGNGAVGRLSSASEGSVSVSLDYGASTASSKWWEQTTFGAKYWQYTKQYRTALIASLHQEMYVSRSRTRWW